MIDRKTLAYVVPFSFSIGGGRVYIPDPPKERVAQALPILGHIYSEYQKLEYSPDVIMQDYEYYAKQGSKYHASKYAKTPSEAETFEAKIFADFQTYITTSLMGATVIMNDGKTLPFMEFNATIDENELDKIEGEFVFFYAIFRYSAVHQKNALGEFITSLSILEYQKSLQTASKDKETSTEIQAE